MKEYHCHREAERRNHQFEETLQVALDEIKMTRGAVAQYGFEESLKAFVNTIHTFMIEDL